MLMTCVQPFERDYGPSAAWWKKRFRTTGLGPKYIGDMLTEYKLKRTLRSLGSSQLEIPRVHAKQGESAFSYFAARSWNQLPEEIRCRKH